MSVVYSLYDALVSIKVPDDKAKAVIDAMEREMMEKLATKSDVENLRLPNKADLDHARDVLSRDIRGFEVASRADLTHAREMLSRDIARVEERVTSSMKTGFAELETRLTLRLAVLMGAMITAATALISAVQYYS